MYISRKTAVQTSCSYFFYFEFINFEYASIHQDTIQSSSARLYNNQGKIEECAFFYIHLPSRLNLNRGESDRLLFKFVDPFLI